MTLWVEPGRMQSKGQAITYGVPVRDALDWRTPHRTWRPEAAGLNGFSPGPHEPSMVEVFAVSDPIPSDFEARRAALVAGQRAHREAEARASGAEAMVAHLKLVIARLKHDRFGASSERGRKLLDQMELQLEELAAAASEDTSVASGNDTTVRDSPARSRSAHRCPRVCRVSAWLFRL